MFVVGAASLGTEIAAARLLAPYFGASTFVWANTIATVLVALSIGYWVGGRLADRAPTLAGLCRLVMYAAAALALVPLVARPFLNAAVKALDGISAGAFAGSLVGVLVLVAGPVLLLGMVSPYAVRLSVQSVEQAGTTTGRLYAISTAGSLLGTFLAALAAVPFAGTHRTFLLFALSLGLIGLTGAPRRFALIPLAILALLLLPAPAIKPSSADARVIYETETPYQYARVLQGADGTRTLELNEGLAVHSVIHPASFLTQDYWDELLVLPFATQPPGAPLSSVAILGNAAGTTARAYGHYFPATAVDGVEIDGRLSELGRRYFDERGPRLRLITADARPFLRASSRRYGAIIVDAYRQPYIPFYLTTKEFFAQCRAHLLAGGSVLINVGHPKSSTSLERVLSATLRTVFPSVERDPVEPTNTILVASTAVISVPRLRAQAPSLAPELQPIALAAAGRLAPALSGGEVYTDDRAPVEWLIDRSILGYAAGKR